MGIRPRGPPFRVAVVERADEEESFRQIHVGLERRNISTLAKPRSKRRHQRVSRHSASTTEENRHSSARACLYAPRWSRAGLDLATGLVPVRILGLPLAGECPSMSRGRSRLTDAGAAPPFHGRGAISIRSEVNARRTTEASVCREDVVSVGQSRLRLRSAPALAEPPRAEAPLGVMRRRRSSLKPSCGARRPAPSPRPAAWPLLSVAPVVRFCPRTGPPSRHFTTSTFNA